MTEDFYRTIKALLMSTKPGELRQGLGLVKSQIAQDRVAHTPIYRGVR